MTLLIILVITDLLLWWFIIHLASKHTEVASLLKLNQEKLERLVKKQKRFAIGIILIIVGIKLLKKAGIFMSPIEYIISGELIPIIFLNFKLVITLIAIQKNKKFRKIVKQIAEVIIPQYNTFKTIT